MLRAGLSLIRFAAGVTHLVRPDLLLPAMLDYIPWHACWIAVTGLIEIAAAIGLWIRRVARISAFGLMAYFVAILPARFHVALHDIPRVALRSPWLWIRIPSQALFIVLVGLMGKILGPLGFLFALSAGEVPLRLGWILLTNDLVWWVPFFRIVVAGWRRHPYFGSRAR
jgi:uncharacterized membrane protein